MVETERFEKAMSWLVCLNKAEDLYNNTADAKSEYYEYLDKRMIEYRENIRQCGYDVDYDWSQEKYFLKRRN